MNSKTNLKILFLLTFIITLFLLGASTVNATTNDEHITFNDLKLKELLVNYNQDGIVCDTNGDHEISITEIKQLDYLSLMGENISDLTGLEYATNLRILYLDYNNIADLSPLSTLTQLTSLGLSENDISDISPLANLTQLSYLSLSNNNVTDISTLKNLNQLTNLQLSKNNLTDISPLASLTQLIEVCLDTNNITNLAPLSALTSLECLDIGCINITDISVLSNLTNLTFLNLYGNNISNISVLKNFTNLTELNCIYNNIEDISSLDNLTKLVYLRLSYNKISDISPLASLTQLIEVDLDHNNITDISPLESLTQLGGLRLGYNNITNISPLVHLTQLTSLGLECNNIIDISALSNLNNLIYLNISDNYIVDFTPILNLNIETLYKDGQKVQNGDDEEKEIITTTNISDCAIDIISDQTYTGLAIEPSITVKYRNTALKLGTDYTISYSNNINAGTAIVTITGIGNFTGIKYITFNIFPKSISTVSVSSINNQTYTGKAIKPNVTIKSGNTTLSLGTDYAISYSDNKSTGKATLIITGIGNYTGTLSKIFYIVPKKVTGVKAKSQTTSSVTLSWSKATGASRYQIQRYNSSKKTWVNVTTTNKTSYKVSKLSNGTTYKFRVRAYKTVSETNKYGNWSSTLNTATKTVTPKISKITAKNKKATIKWKKIHGSTGYEIYMSTRKKGTYKKVTTIKKASTVSYTKSNLIKGKTYYFKIRAYKTVNNKKIYSSYSAVKSIKIKK